MEFNLKMLAYSYAWLRISFTGNRLTTQELRISFSGNRLTTPELVEIC